MPKKPARAKTVAVELPQSPDELDAVVARIGAIQRELDNRRLRLNEEVEEVRNQHSDGIDRLEIELAQAVSSAAAYCGVHRDELTDGGRTKTINLRSGTLRWRLTPPSITIRGVPDVIARLKSLGLERFIRIKEEPNKLAMLAELDVATAVEGISSTQREEFVVLPHSSQIEAVKPGSLIRSNN